MINSVTSTKSVNYQRKQTASVKQGDTRLKRQSATSDNYVSKDTKQNVKNALKDGSLVYNEPYKLLGFITLSNGYYTYIPKNGETIGDIKQKFGIKDGVISSMNPVYDDDYCPAQDKRSIVFRLGE